MAILRGQAALDYLQKNPEGVKRIVSGPEELRNMQVGKKGVGGLAGLVTQPFARLAEGTNQALYRAAQTLTGENIAAQPIAEGLLGSRVTRQIAENPLAQGIGKGAAGLASFAIPGGTGLAQGALRGAAAGALGGVGYSEKGQELQAGGMGALTGGVAGGLLGALANVKRTPNQKLQEWGKKLQNEVLTTRPTATKGGINTFAKSEQIGGELADILDKYASPEFKAMKTPKVTDMLVELDSIKNRFGDATANLRAASSTPVNLTKVEREILNIPLIKENPDLLRKGMVKQVLGVLNNAGDGLVIPGEGISRQTTVENLYRILKQNVDANINYNQAAGVKTGIEQEALKQIQRTIRDNIDLNVGGGYTEANSVFGTIQKFQNAGGDARLWQQARSATPVLNRAGIETVLPGIQDTIGGVKYATGGLLKRLGSADVKVKKEGAREFLEMLARASAPASAGVAGGVAMGMGGEPAPKPHIEGSAVSGVVEQTRPVSIIEALALSTSILPGAKFSEQLSVAKELVRESKPGKVTKEQANAMSGLQSIESMEAILESDKNALLKSYLPFQGFDENAQVLEAAAKNVEDVIARLRTGAVINDEEARRYRKMIPRITDTEESKRFKIEQLRGLFQSIYQTQQGGTSESALADLLGLGQ